MSVKAEREAILREFKSIFIRGCKCKECKDEVNSIKASLTRIEKAARKEKEEITSKLKKKEYWALKTRESNILVINSISFTKECALSNSLNSIAFPGYYKAIKIRIVEVK
jgi:hypothetical protein